MNFRKNRIRYLMELLAQEVDQLPDEEIGNVETALETVYYDLYMLKAIYTAQRSFNPGDILTREEAMQTLPFL